MDKYVSGRQLFQNESPMNILIDHITKEPRLLSEVSPQPIPEALHQIVMMCLQKEPDARPPDARALEAMLSNCTTADDWSNETAETWWQENNAPIEKLSVTV